MQHCADGKEPAGLPCAVFARRVFGPAEQAALGLPLAEEEGTARRIAHTVASAAADFAAKEAFLKAAGTGLREPFSLCEIEAVRLPAGHRPIAFPAGAPSGWKHTACGHISL